MSNLVLVTFGQSDRSIEEPALAPPEELGVVDIGAHGSLIFAPVPNIAL
jgi:hypothetical protein